MSDDRAPVFLAPYGTNSWVPVGWLDELPEFTELREKSRVEWRNPAPRTIDTQRPWIDAVIANVLSYQAKEGNVTWNPFDNDMTHEPTPREEVLSEASGLITGDRNKTYGSPTENFRNTADIWNALLRHKLKPGEEITPTEVATLMVGLKLARTIAQPKRDNFIDMAGYAACGWETQAETMEGAA